MFQAIVEKHNLVRHIMPTIDHDHTAVYYVCTRQKTQDPQASDKTEQVHVPDYGNTVACAQCLASHRPAFASGNCTGSYFDSAPTHPNPPVFAASNCTPSTHAMSHLRRHKHAVRDPDYEITLAQRTRHAPSCIAHDFEFSTPKYVSRYLLDSGSWLSQLASNTPSRDTYYEYKS